MLSAQKKIMHPLVLSAIFGVFLSPTACMTHVSAKPNTPTNEYFSSNHRGHSFFCFSLSRKILSTRTRLTWFSVYGALVEDPARQHYVHLCSAPRHISRCFFVAFITANNVTKMVIKSGFIAQNTFLVAVLCQMYDCPDQCQRKSDAPLKLCGLPPIL